MDGFDQQSAATDAKVEVDAFQALLDGRGWFRTSDLSRVKRALSR